MLFQMNAFVLILCIFSLSKTKNKKKKGCGRKRSDTSFNDPPSIAAEQLSPNDAQSQNDKLGDLIDLNAEPAVEDLMRQIMSQAKLWEAIQEANHEIVMQKAGETERFPMSFSTQ